MRAHALCIAAAAVLAGCGPDPTGTPAPLDAFAYPASMAMVGDDLLVVSTNFDLAYAPENGGSILRLDPQASLEAEALVRRGEGKGVRRIPSFAGEVVATDGAACELPGPPPTVLGPTVFTTSRYTSTLYRFDLEPDGGLSCGPLCETPFPPEMRDSYALQLVCGGGLRPRVFVGHLRTDASRGWLTEYDLATGDTISVDTGTSPVTALAYDAESQRLFFAAGGAGLSSPIRYMTLAGDCPIDQVEQAGGCFRREIDLVSFVRGAEVRSLALSNPRPGVPRRLYVLARLYDADLAELIGAIPPGDIGGAVVVFDLESEASGALRFRRVWTYGERGAIGRGVGQLRVLPARDGRHDVLVVTAAQEGRVYVIDDELGQVVAEVRNDDDGAPLAGRAPFGLAVQDRGGGVARVFVSSFRDDFVSALDVPLDTPAAAAFVAGADGPARIGKAR